MKPYYESGGICIYHGDCRDVLPSVPKADLILTDPPYGIGMARRGNIGSSNLGVVRDYGRSDWDDAPPEAAVFALMGERARWQIVWGGNFFGLPASSCWLVWDKDNTGDFADCELAWTNLPKAVRRIRWRWNGMLQEPGAPREQRQHPTQKPLPVIKWAMRQAPDDCALVLDPFMGSGTTLRAAKDCGRRAIGIEIEERYCEIAAKRLSQEVLPLEASA